LGKYVEAVSNQLDIEAPLKRVEYSHGLDIQMPLKPSFDHNTLRPVKWASQAIADALYLASNNFQGMTKIEAAARFADKCVGNWEKTPEFAAQKRKKYQREFYNAFKSAWSPCDIEARISMRLTRALGIDEVTMEQIGRSIECAKKLGNATVCLYVRTVCNAWTTESRMRDEREPQLCHFGCGQQKDASTTSDSSDSAGSLSMSSSSSSHTTCDDVIPTLQTKVSRTMMESADPAYADSLRHYLSCPVLWQLCLDACTKRELEIELSEDATPREKLGFTDCEAATRRNRVKLIAAVAWAYHQMRQDKVSYGRVLNARNQGDINTVKWLWANTLDASVELL
jgi:hypothetical protein